jgi:uncharacterized protein YndB with AHSA1/START domain
MATVGDSLELPAPVERVWGLYFDESVWPAWVDQFASVVSSQGYPEAGGHLVWRSGSAGRGEVSETVLEHEPRSRHRIRFEDPTASGELTTTFAENGGITTVSLELSYELRAQGVFARVSDVLFVRSQMRASLRRSLVGLGLELAPA